MLTYKDFANLPASEKVVLCKVNANTQYKLFQSEGGGVYSKLVKYWVVDVSIDGSKLVQATSDELDPGQWYFNPRELKLFIRKLDGSEPKTSQVVVTHQFFFSSAPVILPFNLIQGGEEVEWEARVGDNGIGNLGQQLDDENTGIVLESSSYVKLHNNDGFFDDIFDTLIWENQNISFYSWSPKIPLTECKKLFTGIIETKNFSSNEVTFNVKDFIFRMKSKLKMDVFTEADGRFEENYLLSPKRRIYGQVKQARTFGIDKVLDGVNLTGTISGVKDASSFTGTGTAFLKELSPGDEIQIIVEDVVRKITVDSVISNFSFTSSNGSEIDFSNTPATLRPSKPSRHYNRKWHIAGHKLREPEAIIEQVQGPSRFIVDSVDDMFSNDLVRVGSQTLKIKRISGPKIILNQVADPMPIAGDTMRKSCISKVFLGSKELTPDVDYTYTNTGEAILTLDPLAERNIAVTRKLNGISFAYTIGQRTITTTAAIDLKTVVSSRDWIKIDNPLFTEWYEILDVAEKTITIRELSGFMSATQTNCSILYKNVDTASDDSLVTVDCMGMEHEGKWVKTASDAIKHMVTFDAGFSEINEASFAQAKIDSPHILSLVVPSSFGETEPEVKDVSTMINESVNGSVYGNQSMDISFSILNSRKPEGMMILEDHDILSWSVGSTQKIANQVKVNYGPHTDIFSGEDGFKTYIHNSTFVDRVVGISNTYEKNIYLYSERSAKTMAQRFALYKSLSTCKVKVKSQLNLSILNVNDKIFINLNRMYKRFGGTSRSKVGIVVSVKRNGVDSEVEFIDLGNIFNRVASTAPNNATHYSDMNGRDSVRNGYIVDNSTFTPDPLSEDELGNNLIG